jgi:transposase
MRIANTKTEIDRFVAMLCAFRLPCEIAFEPTGDYHRPLGYLLGQAGFHLSLVSSIAVARTREALTTRGTRTIQRTRRSFCIC